MSRPRSRLRGAAVSGVIAATLAGAGMATPGPAFADTQAAMVVTDEAAARSYGALIGARPAPGPVAPEDCTGRGPCDTIPVDVRVPGGMASDSSDAGGHDVLLELAVSWAADNGNSLDAALFDGSPPDTGADVGRNQVPGLVKWTSGQRGSLILRIADPSSRRYSLTVANITGVNRGYRVTARLATYPRGALSATVPGPPAIAGTRGIERQSASADRRSTLGSAHGRPGASAFDGAREISAAAGRRGPGSGSVAAVAAVAAGLLALTGALTWRARRRPGAGAPNLADVRLFWKLMIPYVTVVLVVGIVGTFAIARFLADQAASEASRRAVQASSAVSGYLRDQEFALLDAVRFAANVQGLPEALAASDGAGAERALASVASVNADLDIVAAVDAGGRSLASLVRTGGEVKAHAGEDWAAVPSVRAVLDGRSDAAGDKWAAVVRLRDESPVLIVAGPARTDRPVGAAVVGRRLQPVAVEGAARGNATIAIYDRGGTRIASSDGSLAERWDGPHPLGTTWSSTAGDGAEVVNLASPFSLRDRRLGTLAVAVPADSGAGEARAAALRVAGLVAVALAAIGAIGLMLSRSILRTVNPLLAVNRALGRGDLAARAPVRGRDELGELAMGFNLMAEQLEASYQHLEQRVAERTQELQRLHRAREEFFASVSHELRTPLFAILANSELLADPDLAPDDDVERAEFLATISASAQQLVARVNEMLDLARQQATVAVDLEPVPFDPGRLLDEIGATVAALGRPADVSVTLRRPAALPRVTADRDRLAQILLNLGSNAVKYTPAGGRVDLDAEVDAEELVLTVQDTGIGIPPEVGDKVYEPYYVVDSARAAGRPSTGLGLSTAKRLVEAHGGSISYRSTPSGTTFEVRLPLAGPAGRLG